VLSHGHWQRVAEPGVVITDQAAGWGSWTSGTLMKWTFRTTCRR